MNEKKAKEWHAVTITTNRESSDWISHLLVELGSTGNIEEDCPDPALIAMKGYFPTDLGTSSAITQSILKLLEEKGITPLSTYSTTIKIQNWAENAKQMFSPIKISDDLTIISPWSDYKTSNGEDVLVINPGMAFGTGQHATTQLAARSVISLAREHSIKTMLDVGCGSAVLSIIAAKKGIDHINAVEIDDDARKSAEGNISKNQCDNNIRIFKSINDIQGNFDLVVANILYSIIIDLKEKLIAKVRPGGFLVISGITTDEDEKFRKEFKSDKLKLIKTEEQDGWMCYKHKSSKVKGQR